MSDIPMRLLTKTERREYLAVMLRRLTKWVEEMEVAAFTMREVLNEFV